MPWIVETFGPVVDTELDEFDDTMLARLKDIRQKVALYGPQFLRMPAARPLERGLWELRLKGKNRIGRTIYFIVQGERVILLRAFIKKTQKTPRREIELAWERAKRMMT
jgi:phage-related protein